MGLGGYTPGSAHMDNFWWTQGNFLGVLVIKLDQQHATQVPYILYYISNSRLSISQLVLILGKTCS